mgnify:CR=1 FL=1
MHTRFRPQTVVQTKFYKLMVQEFYLLQLFLVAGQVVLMAEQPLQRTVESQQ